MARARNIKPSFFLNEDIVEMPLEARLLFIGLWTLADREGRLENRPKKIKMSLFPADEINVSEQLSNISKYGFIELYNVNGTDVIQIVNFVKHQTPHGLEKDSELPDQNGSYTVYFRNGKNKTVTGKPLFIKQHQLADFYAKTGEFSPNSMNKDYENSFSGQDTNQENHNDSFIEPVNNGYETVSISDQNALNPESFNLNPDSLNPEIPQNEKFVFDLSVVNTKLKMRGLKEISQDELNKLQDDLKSEYGHKNQMVKNQILGKLAQWVERRQTTPLIKPSNHQKQPASKNVNDAWANQPVFTDHVEQIDVPEDFV